MLEERPDVLAVLALRRRAAAAQGDESRACGIVEESLSLPLSSKVERCLWKVEAVQAERKKTLRSVSLAAAPSEHFVPSVFLGLFADQTPFPSCCSHDGRPRAPPGVSRTRVQNTSLEELERFQHSIAIVSLDALRFRSPHFLPLVSPTLFPSNPQFTAATRQRGPRASLSLR